MPFPKKRFFLQYRRSKIDLPFSKGIILNEFYQNNKLYYNVQYDDFEIPVTLEAKSDRWVVIVEKNIMKTLNEIHKV